MDSSIERKSACSSTKIIQKSVSETSTVMKKVIIVGDVCGHFIHLLVKLQTIEKAHGPFVAAFCVGNFFGESGQELKEYCTTSTNKREIPIPIYFVTGDEENTQLIDQILDDPENGGEICPKLSFLGRSGVKNINGLTVCYLSGVYNDNFYHHPQLLHEKNTNKNASSIHRFYCEKDIKIIHDFNGKVDILLTCEWPRAFHLAMLHGYDKQTMKDLIQNKKNNRKKLSKISTLGCHIISKLAIHCQPQYHFVAHENIFLRIAPYSTSLTVNNIAQYEQQKLIKNQENNINIDNITRMIALGFLISPEKERSLYACNINTSVVECKQASNIKITPCPYSLPYKSLNISMMNKNETMDNPPLQKILHKRKYEEMIIGSSDPYPRFMTASNNSNIKNDPPSVYICYKCGIAGHYINECPKYNQGMNNKSFVKRTPMMQSGNRDDYFFEKFGGRRAMKRARKSGGECWFCLGSSKVESHMVISIGEHSYLALAKGPLIFDHLLLIPVTHLPCSMRFTEPIRREIDRFLLCLEKCYAKDGNKVLLICDRNLPTKYEQHCYLEIFAVEEEKLKGLCDTLKEEAIKDGIQFSVQNKNANNISGEDENKAVSDSNSFVGTFGYLVLHIRNRERYVYNVQSSMKKISLNFLRRVVAVHLGIPEKAEWTVCMQDRSEEVQQTNRIKDKFKAYDWTKHM